VRESRQSVRGHYLSRQILHSIGKEFLQLSMYA
jgi:hypothetical protein